MNPVFQEWRGRRWDSLPGGALPGAAPRGALAPRRRRGASILGLWMFLAALSLQAATGPSEYQVKAAFLFNFLKFTEWPASAFTNAAAPLVVGVMGSDPFDGALEATVKDESVSGRPVVVRRLAPNEAVSGFHALFISRSEKEALALLLESLKTNCVLTLGDCARFCELGGMVNLALSGQTVRPEINPGAASLAGLKLSSKLLNLKSVRHTSTAR